MAAMAMLARGQSAWRAIDGPGRAVVVVLGAGTIVAAGVWLPATVRAVGILAALAPLCWAALVDLAERRLPNALVATSLAATVLALVLVIVGEGFDAGGDVALSVLSGSAAMAAPMLVLHLVSPAGIGFGDVKAGIALGAAVGLVDAWTALVALFAGALLGSVAALARRQRTFPFGPALVAGTLVALVIARAVGVTPAG